MYQKEAKWPKRRRIMIQAQRKALITLDLQCGSKRYRLSVAYPMMERAREEQDACQCQLFIIIKHSC